MKNAKGSIKYYSGCKYIGYIIIRGGSKGGGGSFGEPPNFIKREKMSCHVIVVNSYPEFSKILYLPLNTYTWSVA